MELEYTYFEAEDGFFVGWFDDFPEDVTQGKSLEELEEMLADMYECQQPSLATMKSMNILPKQF
jgi:predicted RNase H-like HicB family nuclease